jgi:tRNA-modifying protein YgfZ
VTRSPLLDLDGAIPAVDPDDPEHAADAGRHPDADVPAHFGDPLGEQRTMSRRAAVVDRSHRGILSVGGADRLGWLHLLLSQQVATLDAGAGTEALVLDAQGRVEHHAVLSHVDDQVWLDVEPGTAEALLAYLTSMTFWSDVTPRDRGATHALLSVVGPDTAEVLTAAGVPSPVGDHASDTLPGGEGVVRTMPWPGPAGGADLIVPRDELTAWWERLRGAGAAAAGLDAFEALRVASVRPRLGLDTDERAIPHEMNWIGSAVHLQKGCYRGQETVSRVANLGRPPRSLVLVHLPSADDPLPAPGTPLLAGEGGRALGRVGTAVRHHELGSVALALVKRSAAAGSGEVWVATDPERGIPGPGRIDPDSVPPESGEPPGRAAMRRLQG